MRLTLRKDITQLVEEAKQRVDRHFDAQVMDRVRQPHVIEAHRLKLAAAQALLSDGLESELISAEADIEGVPAEEMASRIVAAAATHEEAVTRREIERRRLVKELRDATLPADVEDVLRRLGLADAQLAQAGGEEHGSQLPN